MKRLLTLSLASLLATITTGVAFADDDSTNLPTRTLRARHADSTASPAYADMDMEDREEEEDVIGFDEYSAQKNKESKAIKNEGDDVQYEEDVIIQPSNDGLIEEEGEIIEETGDDVY